jgi:hypothetical protein
MTPYLVPEIAGENDLADEGHVNASGSVALLEN